LGAYNVGFQLGGAVAKEWREVMANASKPVDKLVGERLRSRRIALGLSDKDLAAALGTTVKKLQQWEAGIGRIGGARLLKLTEILDVDSVYFFADESPNGLH
jgi:DNA-binding transcriptional regulator YiaG